jgi:PAS domain S-box-containing protein
MSEPLRLLAIEDDQADFLLLVRHLRNQGLDAHCSRIDSVAALESALDRDDWDAVLADYQVPNMDFETTLATVRRRRPGLPVILLSGAVGEERAVELLRLGASDFVSKDRPMRLVPAIERCLREAADRRARAAAEAALRASEERFQLAMEVSRSFAFDWDPASDRVRRSASSAAVLGMDDESPDWDTGEGFFKRLIPEDRGRILALVQSLRPGADRYHAEYSIYRADGALLELEETARAFFDESGQLQRLVGATRDVTERKRVEARLAAQAEQLREADRRKDEFLAMLAHELRNPLTPIVNAVHILKTAGLGESGLAWCREVIERQTGHLTRLVDDLLDISRITRGRIELRTGPLAVANIVQRALETSGPLLEARCHRLSVQLPSEPVLVEGDPVRLAQALSNLLNNAVKYTDPGGQIGVCVECSPTEVAIRVQDNGRGIDPAALPRLFDLFYQADRTLDRAEGGLGVGLSLVERLVAMHGGTVQAASGGLGQGSELTIRLPRLG